MAFVTATQEQPFVNMQDKSNRQQPSHRMFSKIHRHIWEHGIGRRGGEPGIQRRNNGLQQQRILGAFEENARLSLHRAVRQINVSCSRIFRTLKSNHRKAYHLRPIQALHTGDQYRRIQFCRLMYQNLQQRSWLFEANYLEWWILLYHKGSC